MLSLTAMKSVRGLAPIPWCAQVERLTVSQGEDGGPIRWLFSPLGAVFTMRERAPWYRNDERLCEMGDIFEREYNTEWNGWVADSAPKGVFVAPHRMSDATQ